jgi:uncharacterized RDD family membrane protein YckC
MLSATGHPNPDTHSDFYDGVAPKRLFAWLIDLGFTVVIAAPFMLPILLVSVVFIFPIVLIPVIWAVTSFVYLWSTLSNQSATWGMRIMAIELRADDGQRLSSGTAFMHTLGTALSFGFPLVQAISMLFMATGDKGQGITDMVLGTAMLNRAG